MGYKVSDGKAFDVVVPHATGAVTVTINDYDLYRIDGINGVAVGSRAIGDTKTGIALEADTNAEYSIKVPAFVNPRKGMVLFWANQAATTNGTVYQDGATDLRTEPPAVGDQACFFVTGTRNSAGYIRGRVLNGVPTPATVVS